MSDRDAMPRGELVALLNRLLEAERAGARVLAAWLRELQAGSDLRSRLHEIQADEARNCVLLVDLVLAAGGAPSMATGEFHRQALALEAWPQRLEFLNRGQAWVARTIDRALSRIPAGETRRVLGLMRRSHLVNIDACEALLP